MAVVHGSTCAVYIGGTSTAFSAEAMADTSLGEAADTAVYQISTASKNLWNATVAPTIYDGVTTLTEGTDYEVESYLFGRIRFLEYTPIAAITADGEYLPKWEVTRASAYSLSHSKDTPNITKFGATVIQRMAGTQDVTFTLSRFEFGGTDYDTGAGSKRFHDLAAAGTTIYLEFQFGTGNGAMRLACLVESDTYKTGANEVVTAELSGKVTAVNAGTDYSYSAFAREGSL